MGAWFGYLCSCAELLVLMLVFAVVWPCGVLFVDWFAVRLWVLLIACLRYW